MATVTGGSGSFDVETFLRTVFTRATARYGMAIRTDHILFLREEFNIIAIQSFIDDQLRSASTLSRASILRFHQTQLTRLADDFASYLHVVVRHAGGRLERDQLLDAKTAFYAAKIDPMYPC